MSGALPRPEPPPESPPPPKRSAAEILFGKPIAGAVPYHAPTPPSRAQVARSVPPTADGAHALPDLPPIGRPEMYYARLVREADRAGDCHAHEAAKVGQYVTLALDPNLAWDQKLRYFRHALRRHCAPPPLPDDDVWLFYRKLADLVRTHCGAEALRLASAEDDVYAAMSGLGKTEDEVADIAGPFFLNLMGHQQECPEWFGEEDWNQLRMIRDQWI